MPIDVGALPKNASSPAMNFSPYGAIMANAARDGMASGSEMGMMNSPFPASMPMASPSPSPSPSPKVSPSPMPTPSPSPATPEVGGVAELDFGLRPSVGLRGEIFSHDLELVGPACQLREKSFRLGLRFLRLGEHFAELMHALGPKKDRVTIDRVAAKWTDRRGHSQTPQVLMQLGTSIDSGANRSA